MKLDLHSVYEPRSESIRTGDGRHIRLRELHKALASQSPFTLRKLVTRAGIHKGVNDPMEAGKNETVDDILSIVRAMPQYGVPVVEAGRSLEATRGQFEHLIRDRMFGTADAEASMPKTSGAVSGSAMQVREARPDEWVRDDDVTWCDAVGKFFWDTRENEGEFTFFVKHDRKFATLRAGQRFSGDEPFRQCFLIVRTSQRRFFLRWPSEHRHVPSYYLGPQGEPLEFWPRPLHGEKVDFEEIFPGWTYEVFGVQFGLPNLGTDYRFFDVDIPIDREADEPEAPISAAEPDRVKVLLVLLEAPDVGFSDEKELSRHFRKISLKYHPLKHLQAAPAEKERIDQRYLEITNAYNELKGYLR